MGSWRALGLLTGLLSPKLLEPLGSPGKGTQWPRPGPAGMHSAWQRRGRLRPSFSCRKGGRGPWGAAAQMRPAQRWVLLEADPALIEGLSWLCFAASSSFWMFAAAYACEMQAK